MTHQKFNATPEQIPPTAPKTRHYFLKAVAKHLIMHPKSHLHSSSLSEHIQAAHSAAVAGCRAPNAAAHPILASTGPVTRTGRKAANTSKWYTGNGGQITLTLPCEEKTQTGFAQPLRLNGDNWVLLKQTTCFSWEALCSSKFHMGAAIWYCLNVILSKKLFEHQSQMLK